MSKLKGVAALIKAVMAWYETMEDGGDDCTTDNLLRACEKYRKANGLTLH